MEPECPSLVICCLICKLGHPQLVVPSAWSALPHCSPWPEQGHVCPSPSLVPSLWQGPGFHVLLSQLHEAHACLPALLEP